MNFLRNIIWLNVRKLKINIFWKLVFVLINFLLLFASALRLPNSTYLPSYIYFFIFTIATLSNILFEYIKITYDKSEISLLRSLGASRPFIMVNNMFEIFLLFMISVILFCFVLIAKRPSPQYFLLSLSELLIIITASTVFSFITILKVEKTQKAL